MTFLFAKIIGFILLFYAFYQFGAFLLVSPQDEIKPFTFSTLVENISFSLWGE